MTGATISDEKKIHSAHNLMLENRQNVKMTGIKDIKSFDEKGILLFTEAGKLLIKGEADLEGKVDSLTYLSKNTDKKEESLLKRMFR